MAAAVSRWTNAAANRTWANRTLRVLVSPEPLSFADRRSVLQVLQRQGTIEAFRIDPNYHGRFIAIAQSEDTADKLLAASPLSYSIAGPPEETLDINYIDLAKPDLLDGTKVTIYPEETGPKADEDGQVHKKYTLGITKAQHYKHSLTMNSSYLHGPWPPALEKRETLMSSILKQSLPHNMARPGLACWDYATQGDDTVPNKKTERLQMSRWLPSKVKKKQQEGAPERDEPE